MGIRNQLTAIVCAATLAMVSLAAATPASASLEPQALFPYTGAPRLYTVPDGVTSIEVLACGAQGGTPRIPDFVTGPTGLFFGGLGGAARRTITVTPGEVLSIHVGGSGKSGGWNGGGLGGANGGGASDVRQGGTTLAHRVVVGGGGGGGGLWMGSPPSDLSVVAGGGGGGLSGGGSYPGTQTGAGTVPVAPARNGALGTGGNGTASGYFLTASGGGGGLFGGAAGSYESGGFFGPDLATGGSGGSGLGDELITGDCIDELSTPDLHGFVLFSYDDPSGPPRILPLGGTVVEGDAGSSTVVVPVSLSRAYHEDVTVEWSTGDLPMQPGNAQAGSDFVAASGTVTFVPGQTRLRLRIEVLGDTDPETPLLWGEWGVVNFSNPINATIDTGPFFGAGLFIILDDD